MLQRYGVEMVVMAVRMMGMMMMILMNPSSMTMAMATISPLREGISPADFCLPESFSLCVVSAPSWRQNIFAYSPSTLGFLKGYVCEGGEPRGHLGTHTMWWRGLALTRATPSVGPRCPPQVLLLAPSVI
jgi:hypothetical protein